MSHLKLRVAAAMQESTKEPAAPVLQPETNLHPIGLEYSPFIEYGNFSHSSVEAFKQLESPPHTCQIIIDCPAKLWLRSLQCYVCFHASGSVTECKDTWQWYNKAANKMIRNWILVLRP